MKRFYNQYKYKMSKVNTTTSNCSYEQYMKDQSSILSNNFIIKCYKRVNKEVWQGFDKEMDRVIQIRWKDKPIYEFLIEKAFWFQRNTNKEDRVYMRLHADEKIKRLQSAIIKKPSKNISSKIKPKIKPKVKQEIGYTQTLFENAKK